MDHKALLRNVVESPSQYPEGRFSGEGVVICGGGFQYFPSAWVNIRILRYLGCQLPIQLWHLGEGEIDSTMRELVGKFGVECVDACELRKNFPVRILNGWELKPFSIINSPFENVIMLDADVVATADPTHLLRCGPFLNTGAIFWPDYGRLEEDREIWSACSLDYRDEPEFESGQIVISKKKTWHALQVVMHMNEFSDHYYDLVHGDKETFHMGFLCTGTEYAMPSAPIEPLEATMCQHDFLGKRIFQHRNLDKWSIVQDANIHIDGFWFEEKCFEFLADLRTLWHSFPTRIPRYSGEQKTSDERALAKRLVLGRYLYIRAGHDSRRLTFHIDGTIGEGRAERESFWDIFTREGKLTLMISGSDAVTCWLKDDGGIWKGYWTDYERMPVIIMPDH